MTTTEADDATPRFSAVVFDLFITLTDWEAERRSPDRLLELAEVLEVDGPAFASMMWENFTERATGRLGDLPSTLRELCRRMGSDPPESCVDAAISLRLSHVEEQLRPREGVLAVLAQLKAAGLRLGVITDCTTEVPPLWLRLPYADLVDAAVFSCQVGQRKPHRSLYEEAARRLGVQPQACLYVGDGGSGELTGAQAVGMTACLLETPFSDLHRCDAEPDWKGTSIGDLDEISLLIAERP